MRLLVNIGNTVTTAALNGPGGAMRVVQRIPTQQLTGGELPEIVRHHPDVPCYVACVVPDAGRQLAKRTGAEVTFVEAAMASSPDFSQVAATELGQDRIANAVAAMSVAGPPCIVLDCGTATTIEAIDDGGMFRGGCIAPGRVSMRHSLHQSTAQLPDVPLQARVSRVLGTHTELAIRAGVDHGILGMARELVLRTREELHVPRCPVLVTGGDADFFLNHLGDRYVRRAPQHFTLLGIAAIADATEKQ